MKKSRIRDRIDERVDINMSPLIDCVFLLLIFFIVTTVFVEETGLDVQRPEAVSSQDLEKQSILIALSEKGDVFFGGRDIGMAGVRGVVARQLREQAMPVIILADEEARTASLVRVIDECKRGGAAQVSIASKRP